MSKRREEEHTIIILAALAAISFFVIFILADLLSRPAFPTTDTGAYYPSPSANVTSPNLKIEKVAVGSFPVAWPKGLALVGVTNVIQAYGTYDTKRHTRNGTFAFRSSVKAQDVFVYYHDWAAARGWSSTRQGDEAGKTLALYALGNKETLLVVINQEQVSVTYAQR